MRLWFLSVVLGLVVLASAREASANPHRRTKELTFIYLRGPDDVMMSGSSADLGRVKRALESRAGGGQRVLWFRTTDGRELVVRDDATLNQLEQLWQTATELGERQGVLGSKIGVLGAKQGTIGTRQGAVGMRMGALHTQLAYLAERDDSAATTKRRDLERELAALDRKMQALDAKMRELDKPMRELSRQMEELGKKHEAAAKRAHADTETLIARTIASGIAKPF